MAITLEELTSLVAETSKAVKETSRKVEILSSEMKDFKDEMKDFKDRADESFKKLDSLWVTAGLEMEDVVYTNIQSLLSKKWVSISKYERNVQVNNKQWKSVVEFDIIWINWKEIYIAEVKNKFEKKHLTKFKKNLKLFREYFPEYSSMRLYWIMWTRVATPKIKQMAQNSWFLLMKKAYEWNAEFVDLPWLEMFEY